MSLSADDVRRIAQLARLAISEDEVERTLTDLNRVFELIEQMRATDTSALEPMTHPHEQPLRLREDLVTEIDQREALQAVAPETAGGLYLVPKVIE
ncbi:MAG: Asp-tRNA(Asn)/Glu-tRNA(Gln) amidotransferase subunit GatC [Burkholderiaceae bacterium]